MLCQSPRLVSLYPQPLVQHVARDGVACRTPPGPDGRGLLCAYLARRAVRDADPDVVRVDAVYDVHERGSFVLHIIVFACGFAS